MGWRLLRPLQSIRSSEADLKIVNIGSFWQSLLEVYITELAVQPLMFIQSNIGMQVFSNDQFWVRRRLRMQLTVCFCNGISRLPIRLSFCPLRKQSSCYFFSFLYFVSAPKILSCTVSLLYNQKIQCKTCVVSMILLCLVVKLLILNRINSSFVCLGSSLSCFESLLKL